MTKQPMTTNCNAFAKFFPRPRKTVRKFRGVTSPKPPKAKLAPKAKPAA
jgi:hypothetical protein